MRFYNFISGLFIKVYSAKKYDFFYTKKIIRIDFILFLLPPPLSKLLEEGYGEERFSKKRFLPIKSLVNI